MTKEELEKATGQELIEQRDYCGRDNYYRDYLDNVNAEMLKRFNRLAELEKENEELRNNGFTVSAMTEQQLKAAIEKGEQLEKENAELKAEIENDRDLPTVAYMQGAENQKKKDEKQLAKAKEIIALGLRVCETSSIEYMNLYQKQAEQFLEK